MNRRQVLATAAAVTLAGCQDAIEGVTGGDDEPLYTGVDNDELPPPATRFGDDWTRDDDNETASDWQAFYLTTQEDEFVGMNVRIGDSVDSASEAMKELQNRVSDPQSFNAGGDEAYWSEGNNIARGFIRHSNAVAEFGSSRQSGITTEPNRSRIFTAAGETVAYWKEEVV